MRKKLMKKNPCIAIAVIFCLHIINVPMIAYCATTSVKTLPKGTAIKLELTEDLSSQENKVGDIVRYRVVNDVAIDGIVFVKRDSEAIGKVVEAKPAKGWGKGGKLDISIETVDARDGTKVSLVASMSEGKGWAGLKTIGGVALLGLAFGGGMKGKKVNIPKGTQIEAFVEQDTPIKVDPKEVAKQDTPPPIKVDTKEVADKPSESQHTTTTPGEPKVEMIVTKVENGVVTFNGCLTAGLKPGFMIKAYKVVASKTGKKQYPYADLEVLNVAEGFCAAKLVEIKPNVSIAVGDTLMPVEMK